jgi:hypothetical protein
MLELGNGNAVVGGGMVRSSNEIRRESCLWPGLSLVANTPAGATGLSTPGRQTRNQVWWSKATDFRQQDDKHYKQQSEPP